MNVHKSRQTFALLLSLALLAAFAVEAAASTARLKFDPSKQAKKSRIPEMMLALNLTEEQKQKLEPVYEEQGKKQKAARQDSSLIEDARKAKLREINQETNRQLKEILTSEQFQKLRELRKAKQQSGTPNTPQKPQKPY